MNRFFLLLFLLAAPVLTRAQSRWSFALHAGGNALTSPHLPKQARFSLGGGYLYFVPLKDSALRFETGALIESYHGYDRDTYRGPRGAGYFYYTYTQQYGITRLCIPLSLLFDLKRFEIGITARSELSISSVNHLSDGKLYQVTYHAWMNEVTAGPALSLRYQVNPRLRIALDGYYGWLLASHTPNATPRADVIQACIGIVTQLPVFRE